MPCKFTSRLKFFHLRSHNRHGEEHHIAVASDQYHDGPSWVRRIKPTIVLHVCDKVTNNWYSEVPFTKVLEIYPEFDIREITRVIRNGV